MAHAVETAGKNAKTLQGATSHAGDTRKASLYKTQSWGKAPHTEESSTGYSCYRCDNTAHKATQCPYKEAKSLSWEDWPLQEGMRQSCKR